MKLIRTQTPRPVSCGKCCSLKIGRKIAIIVNAKCPTHKR